MRLLLDTHAFLWWVSEDPKLSRRARSAIANGRNDVLFSAASAWELALKVGSDKLEVPEPLDAFVADHLRTNGFDHLPVHLRHALAVAGLPKLHGDPFDRLLVAQCLQEGLTLVSGDEHIARYEVDVLW